MKGIIQSIKFINKSKKLAFFKDNNNNIDAAKI